jgi:hypothetical protein
MLLPEPGAPRELTWIVVSPSLAPLASCLEPTSARACGRCCPTAGVGLLVFADLAWAHGLGAVCVLAGAMTVFALVSQGEPG